MSEPLASQYEAFIQERLAAGKYPSREKLVEAALDALRESEDVPYVCDEHMALVEEGLEDLAAGRVVEADVEGAVRRLHERLTTRKGA